MTEFLEKLISALREELQQYGEMLARLDDQQELVMRRAAAAVLASVPQVQSQSALLTQVRDVRFAATKAVCGVLRLPADATFKELLPRIPADYRPLLEALVHENNELLHRIHQRARQNHILLSRTVESMQHVINSLGIHRPTAVYDDSGTVFNPAPARSAMYEAVC
ncbi:MAG TPA: flagellar protein FlgN [Candidatus Kapabacteria bacterium]|nr:flagellar protein FlgN [Candidatus Kapabacteria bacterium]